MKKDSKKKLVYRFSQVLGTSLIVAIAVGISFQLYQNGFEEKVFTNNYTTSILYSDSLATASGAAPWALMSLNWFLCRSVIKRWFLLLKKYFG